MANNFNARPITIDTAMGVSWRNQPNFVGLPPFYPRMVYWFNPLNPGDLFTIVDTVRNETVLTGRCESANQSQIFPLKQNNHCWADWQVTVISSGTLLIW